MDAGLLEDHLDGSRRGKGGIGEEGREEKGSTGSQMGLLFKSEGFEGEKVG